MDIAQAKQELRRTIRAYTAKTEDGVYRMPRRMQRPVLLIGPPGIGKTAILSQLAQEEHIGLAAYTMTHHTRQSALGLPVIVGRTAAGKTFRATEYTMSEIIASVYEQMEKTGLHEGILFLDEINCVSETLMPAILQMLQNKTFGVHSLPEGWLIVAAGNPPRYNQSARSFDMATLDRVRCIELEPSLAAWQPYAAAGGVHPAVLSYLRLHPEHFFLCSASAAAGEFATARGWEELSALLLAYEALGYPCTLAQMQQYLHAQEAAAGFAAFYELFRRYAAQLPLEEILTGTACPEAGALRELPFDGRLSVVEFLLHSLQTKSAAMQQDADLAFSASSFAGSVPPGADALARAQELLQKRRAALAVRKDCGVLPPEEERREAAFLSRAEAALAQNGAQARRGDARRALEKHRVDLGGEAAVLLRFERFGNGVAAHGVKTKSVHHCARNGERGNILPALRREKSFLCRKEQRFAQQQTVVCPGDHFFRRVVAGQPGGLVHGDVRRAAQRAAEAAGFEIDERFAAHRHRFGRFRDVARLHMAAGVRAGAENKADEVGVARAVARCHAAEHGADGVVDEPPAASAGRAERAHCRFDALAYELSLRAGDARFLAHADDAPVAIRQALARERERDARAVGIERNGERKLRKGAEHLFRACVPAERAGHTALLERFRNGLSRLVKADASGAQICAAGVEHENALARARRARRGKERRQHHQRRGLSAQTGAHVGDVGVRQLLKGLLLIEHVVSPEKFFGGFLCTHSGLSPVRARLPASGM